MLNSSGLSVADALALRNGGSNDDGWGGANGAWWIIILILFMALGGWGRNGFGNNEGNSGGGNSGYNVCCTPATAQGLTDAFNFNQLDNGQRSLERGICDGFYTTSANINAVAAALQNCCCQTQQAIGDASALTQQSIANLGYQVNNGFCGVDKSIMQNSFQNQTGFNSIANQLASCCCDLGRGQENIKYAIADSTAQLVAASNQNADRIINHMVQSELQNLRNELQSAQFQLSQNAQTNNIINQLLPVAKPAYITCSPFASAYGYQPCNTCA